MRQPIDAIRSMKKYVTLALGSEWEVRMVGEVGAFHRPFCRVGPSPGMYFRNQGALVREVVQPFSIVCHPVEQASADLMMLEAHRVAGLINDAFTIGVHAPSYRERGGFVVGGQAYSINRGHPLRVPLWDYTGVAVNQAVDDSARDSRDFMKVVGNVTCDVVTDENDELLMVVAAAVTMSWTVSAAVLSEAMTVLSVPVEPKGP